MTVTFLMAVILPSAHHHPDPLLVKSSS